MVKKRFFYFLLILIAVFSAVILAFSMRMGPGIGGDATIYITSARNLISGRGLGLIGPTGEFRLIPYFPPGFPLLLSLFGLLGFSYIKTAFWLNLIFYSGLVFLVGYMLYRVIDMMWISLLGTSILAASPVLIPAYSWAMSEPLSNFTGFLAIALLLIYLRNPESRWLFFFSAFMAGYAVLTRYSAIVFGIVCMLTIFLFTKHTIKRRIINAVSYFGISITPLVVWLFYDITQTDTVASRSIEPIAGMIERLIGVWKPMGEVFLFWLIPDSWITDPFYPGIFNWLLVIGFILVLVVWIFMSFNWQKNSQDNAIYSEQMWLFFMLVAFIVLYIGLIVMIYTTTYPPITIGSRMFSPVHITVLTLVALLAGITVNKVDNNKKNFQWLVYVGLSLTFIWYGTRCIRIVEQNYRLGLGYLSLAWQQSDTIEQVKTIPENVPIITNEEMAILFILDRPSYPLAEIYYNEPIEEFYRYGDGQEKIDIAQQVFRNEQAAFVLFDSVYDQLSSIYNDQTEIRVEYLVKGLELDYQGKDGRIFYYPDKQ